MSVNPELKVGIDIGGTFTDFVVYQPVSGQIETFKLLSTPADPSRAVLEGMERILRRAGQNTASVDLIHGSTVATNALLERKGACTAFIATRGFRDLLLIGRQNRPELYNLNPEIPAPLLPEELCFEVDERLDSQGRILEALNPDQIDSLIPRLKDLGVQSVAVCLLFSFANPAHEAHIAKILRQAGFLVSPSSEILPEFREYERASTTTVNAYVSPVLDQYLSNLQQALGKQARLRVMQSNGGNISLEEARRNGVRCILSGPAGGVIGAHYAARLAFPETAEGVRVITLDMGGTSTDVSLIDNNPQITTEAMVGGYPIRIPVLDIHTIGAGGGSIARLDAGGALRVGPQSAGADPGPACYGKGELPTVTDANLVLGRLLPEHFLGGAMPLDADRAHRALSRLGKEMGLDAYQAALGVVAVANTHMERALRLISVERGYDPLRFTLLSFGGAGGLHAADLARRLNISRLLVPPLASTLSAFGMLAAQVVKDYTQTVMLAGDTRLEEISLRLQAMQAVGREELLEQGVAPENICLQSYLDMRYQGQSYELTIPYCSNLAAEFHKTHQQTYGYAHPEAPLEFVNLRLQAIGRVSPPSLAVEKPGSPDPNPALLGHYQTILRTGAQPVPFYRGESLRAGNTILGPAVVVRADTTILIEEHDRAQVDQFGNLLIAIG